LFTSSIDKARQALAGNWADRLEEKKQKEKEATRKKYQEEERAKRDDMFRQLVESKERYERAAEARRESFIKQGGCETETDSSEPNGGPSFVTEDTVLDSIIYTDQNGFDSHHDTDAQLQETRTIEDPPKVSASRPSAPFATSPAKQPISQQSPARQALAMHANPPAFATHSPRLRAWETGVKHEMETKTTKTPIISLDSDDDSEPENSRYVP
jgi:hypothetical protein